MEGALALQAGEHHAALVIEADQVDEHGVRDALLAQAGGREHRAERLAAQFGHPGEALEVVAHHDPVVLVLAALAMDHLVHGHLHEAPDHIGGDLADWLLGDDGLGHGSKFYGGRSLCGRYRVTRTQESGPERLSCSDETASCRLPVTRVTPVDRRSLDGGLELHRSGAQPSSRPGLGLEMAQLELPGGGVVIRHPAVAVMITAKMGLGGELLRLSRRTSKASALAYFPMGGSPPR